MTRKVLHVALNGVTGRMGYRQHLVRSLLSIREQGGVRLADGSADRPRADPGRAQRGAAARDRRAARPAALVDPPGRGAGRSRGRGVLRRPGHQRARAEPGPGHRRRASTCTPRSRWPARWTARCGWPAPPARSGITNGVVQDKLFLPGVIKLRRLVREGFFGRVLAVRLEFGYWVFEGDGLPAQRPSWNYRARGRRRHRAGHVPALAVPAGGPVRPGHGGVRAAGHARAAAVGRDRGALRRHRRRRGVRRAGTRGRRAGVGQLVLGGPGEPA